MGIIKTNFKTTPTYNMRTFATLCLLGISLAVRLQGPGEGDGEGSQQLKPESAGESNRCLGDLDEDTLGKIQSEFGEAMINEVNLDEGEARQAAQKIRDANAAGKSCEEILEGMKEAMRKGKKENGDAYTEGDVEAAVEEAKRRIKKIVDGSDSEGSSSCGGRSRRSRGSRGSEDGSSSGDERRRPERKPRGDGSGSENDRRGPKGSGDEKEPRGSGDEKEPRGSGDDWEPKGSGDDWEPKGSGDDW